jgi:hypothetical protein
MLETVERGTLSVASRVAATFPGVRVGPITDRLALLWPLIWLLILWRWIVVKLIELG